MSTNYYMITTDKNLVEKYFPFEYEITDDPYLSYEIHIGKRSLGWKPLFEAHKNAYDSVAGLLYFLSENKNKIEIYDEYGKLHTIEQLKEELIDWGDYQTKKVIEYERVGKIQSPIDHVEIAEKESEYSWVDINYWHDRDGYDFTDRSFS